MELVFRRAFAGCRNHWSTSRARILRKLTGSVKNSNSKNYRTYNTDGRRTGDMPSKVFKSTIGKTAVVLSLGATGATGAYLVDDIGDLITHSSMAAERSARIVTAAFKCFADYRSILGKQYDSDEERNQAISQCHKRCALITLKVLEANAGIYIKFGQHISALTYLLPPEWTTTFIPLQDRCPVSSIESIRQMFKNDTATELEDVFSEFNPVPLGTASLAQVHKAVLRDSGEEVAVKLQHPSLAQFIPLDLKLTKWVFNAIDKFFPEYPMTWLYDELNSSIYVELDFTEEAKNATRTQKYFKNLKKKTALRIPNVVWAKPRILVMEYIGGYRPDDIASLDKDHISRNEVSICLSHIFNTMIFTPGVLIHCDPHSGNLAVRPLPKGEQGPWYNRGHNFEIVLYDHGLYRDASLELRRSYAKFWLAIIDNDEPNMRKYAKEFAGISDAQFPLFASAITGREFSNVKNSGLNQPRTRAEVERIMASLRDGLMPSLIKLLANVPRVVLLILKTNDLTRALDENLHTTIGPERTFLIMANYCAKTVYDEDKENLRRYFILSPARLIGESIAYSRYVKRVLQMELYDITLWFRNMFKIGGH
ncbi:ABC1 family-domain-containing protein [Lipomyces japonicus]|uniref:ABC1 family-domain-containing protein n=1 Tax=Lipomyces japonicus TaxID=56871 RepID=UPI0034CE9B75